MIKVRPWVKITIAIVFWAALFTYQKFYMNFDVVDAGIAQLENSDEAYADLQKWRTIKDYFWLLYLLPLLMFVNLLFKKN
jgi:hypothetical protein